MIDVRSVILDSKLNLSCLVKYMLDQVCATLMKRDSKFRFFSFIVATGEVTNNFGNIELVFL